ADLMCNWNGNQAWTRALEFWHTRSCAQTRAAKRSPYLRRRYLDRSSAVASAASDWSCASARHCSTDARSDMINHSKLKSYFNPYSSLR
ncbi:hypothetical protein PF001_g33405, partial [Phytophthora fragariae]